MDKVTKLMEMFGVFFYLLSTTGGNRLMFDFVAFIFSFFDPRLVPWIFVLNILGFWLKRYGLPKWCPPLPVLLFFFAFMISAFFGWLISDAEDLKTVLLSIVFYGLGNGSLIGFMAVFGYDIVHAFFKKKEVKN